jgi:hypothetical protein
MVQIGGLLFALVFSAKPLPTIEGLELAAKTTNISLSFIGIFLLYYGINLVVANVLTIFTIIELKPPTRRKKVDPGDPQLTPAHPQPNRPPTSPFPATQPISPVTE